MPSVSLENVEKITPITHVVHCPTHRRFPAVVCMRACAPMLFPNPQTNFKSTLLSKAILFCDTNHNFQQTPQPYRNHTQI